MLTARILTGNPVTRLKTVGALMALGAVATPAWGCAMQSDTRTQLFSILTGILMATWAVLGSRLSRLVCVDATPMRRAASKVTKAC